MNDESLNYHDELSDDELLQDYKSSLQLLEAGIRDSTNSLLKAYINQFRKLSHALLARFENYFKLVNRDRIVGKLDASSDQFLAKLKDEKSSKIKNEIHKELKDVLINKFLKLCSEQDSKIQFQNKEIEKIKAQFEKILLKNKDIAIDNPKINESSSSNNIVYSKKESPRVENRVKNVPSQNNLSTLNHSYNKETETRKEIKKAKKMDANTFMELDLEADRIYNEPDANITKLISQSPINSLAKIINKGR
jgi:hypothetical protein